MMLSILKNHPFGVEAFFKSSLVLTFATPQQNLQHFIPECLSLDCYQDKWAFLAVAMVETQNLRPKGFPICMGNDFFLIGYRVFVRYTTSAGKNLRGLYILKSETDKKKMELLGNIFTHYNYTTTDIERIENENTNRISSVKSKFDVSIYTHGQDIHLPTCSPFPTWKEARKYAGPLPFTFSYNKKSKEVLIIEGVRQNWVPTPVAVIEYSFNFINQLNLNNLVLANAFEIQNIPYSWEKGKIDKWK